MELNSLNHAAKYLSLSPAKASAIMALTEIGEKLSAQRTSRHTRITRETVAKQPGFNFARAY